MIASRVGKIATLTSDNVNSCAPLLHFAHATGFNAETYRRFLEQLSASFRVVASDARGHGRTTLPAIPERLTSWETYELDLEELLGVYKEPAFLVGHSIGATVSVMLAARRPDLVLGVGLLEPSFVPFERAYRVASERREGRIVDFDIAIQARKRRSTWASLPEIRESYAKKAMFATWQDGFLEDYLEGGLVFLANDQIRLACDPSWEAATFQAATTDFWDILPRYKGKLLLAYGSRFSTVSDVDAKKIVELAPQTRVFNFQENSHFLPMERPEALSRLIMSEFDNS